MTRYWDDKTSVVGSGKTGAKRLGMSQKIRGIISSMDGIQEEEFGVSPSKRSMYKSVSELASLIQVQGDAIKGIEKETNAMMSRVEVGSFG